LENVDARKEKQTVQARERGEREKREKEEREREREKEGPLVFPGSRKFLSETKISNILN